MRRTIFPLALIMRFTFLLTPALVLLSACSHRSNEPQHISRIIFSSYGCFGSCPVMNVDIHENGDFYFQGEVYTEKIGFYHASNQQSAFAQLREILSGYDLDSLEENYAVSVTDQPAYCIKIYYDDQAVTTHVYGEGSEPRQINSLIASLEAMYKSIPLERDTTVHDYRIGKNIYRQHIDFLPPGSITNR